jgi:hypothetical protein
MTDGENLSMLDELERNGLQKIISEVEAASAGSTPASRGVFESVLQGAKARLDAVEKKIKDSKEDREKRAQNELVAISLARCETALSAKEQETFSSFLGKEFFTKKDFPQLEEFYANTWERLSDRGKDAMSQRIWEGVRRDEFEFHELPSSAKDKEMKWAYTALTKRDASASMTGQIPRADRDDFIHAYESGDKREAENVLGRRSFRENMFLGETKKEVRHSAAYVGREEKAAVLFEKSRSENGSSASKNTQENVTVMGSVDLDALLSSTNSPEKNTEREVAATDLPRTINDRGKPR